MGQTNIHNASALLSRAGSSFSDQAVIQPFGKAIYLDCESLAQEDINKLGKLLNCCIQDQWISTKANVAQIFQPTTAPDGMAVPKICVTHGLDRRLIEGDPLCGVREPAVKPKEPLSFILVVQGINASERSKIVTKQTLESGTYRQRFQAVLLVFG